MSHQKPIPKIRKPGEEEEKIWPERSEPQCRLPRAVIKWLVSLKLKNKFLHPRWDAASGVLIAEILSRYYPETGPGYILPVCYGHGWKHFEKNWFFLKQFFKSAELDFPSNLITPLKTRKGNAGYFALLWLWEIFELKTKLPRIELGALEPTSQGTEGKEAPKTCVNDDVFKNVDFFHHDRKYQQSLPISQRETHSTCFRQNITGNQMKWDDCHQSWAGWSNRLWEEQKVAIGALKTTDPKRMGERRNNILWKGVRRPQAPPRATQLSRGTETTVRSNASHASVARHANVHAGLLK